MSESELASNTPHNHLLQDNKYGAFCDTHLKLIQTLIPNTGKLLRIIDAKI